MRMQTGGGAVCLHGAIGCTPDCYYNELVVILIQNA